MFSALIIMAPCHYGNVGRGGWRRPLLENLVAMQWCNCKICSLMPSMMPRKRKRLGQICCPWAFYQIILISCFVSWNCRALLYCAAFYNCFIILICCVLSGTSLGIVQQIIYQYVFNHITWVLIFCTWVLIVVL